MRTRSEDRFPVATEYDDFVKEEEKDMWSLMRQEPGRDAFGSLLAGDGGKNCKENDMVTAGWDFMPWKGYVPIDRSRSCMSDDSLQLCTEGLGCESCDCSPSSESSSVIVEDYLLEDEAEVIGIEKEEKNLQSAVLAKSFPLPLRSLSYMRSLKKDGRFLLQSVKLPLQNHLHSYREGGRVKMHLVRTTVGFALPLTSDPENEIMSEEQYESDEERLLEIGSNPLISDIPAVQESESLLMDFANKLFDAVFNSSLKCNKIAPAEFKVACNNKPAIAKRKIPEAKSSVKASSTSLVNVSRVWRSELAKQSSSGICKNWEKGQFYRLNKYAEAQNVKNVYVNFNESCVPKLRLRSCHDPEFLSVGQISMHCYQFVKGKNICRLLWGIPRFCHLTERGGDYLHYFFHPF